MKIEKVDNNKIKVFVNSDEQKEYGVTYDTMEWNDKNTRKMCENIVSIAKSQVGFRIGNDKLLVEAKRSNSDSIILYLSRVPVSQNDSEYLYNKIICFSDMDCFIDSYKVFKKYMESFKNSVLYFYDNEYYLYFEIASTRKNFDILIRLISEYGECSEINKCILDEHGQQVSASGDVKRVLTANVQNE